MVRVLKKKSAKSLKLQLEEMLQRSTAASRKRKWSKFFGKVKFSEEPVAYQRKLRDE